MKAPLYERQVSDAGPVEFRQHGLDESAGLYEAAKARARGTANMAQGVQALGVAFDKIQQDRDDIAVSRAISDFYKASTNANYNPEGGYFHTTGEAAIGVTGRVTESDTKLAEEAKKKLTAYQKRKFDEGTANYIRSNAATAMKYESAQVTDYKQTEAKRVIDNGTTAWSVNPDLAPEAQLDMIRTASDLMYGRTGNAEIDMKNVKRTEQMFIENTTLKIAATDPLRANDFLKKYGTLLDEGARQELQLKVDKVAKPVMYDKEAEALYARNGLSGYSKGIEEIERTTPEGADRDGKIQALSQLYSLRGKQAQEEMFNAESQADVLIYDKHNSTQALQYIANAGSELEKKYGEQGRVWRIQQKDKVQRFFDIGPYAPKHNGGGSGSSIFKYGAAERWCMKNIPGFASKTPDARFKDIRNKLGISDQQYTEAKQQLTSMYIFDMTDKTTLNNYHTLGFLSQNDISDAELLKKTVGERVKARRKYLNDDIQSCMTGGTNRSINFKGYTKNFTQEDVINAQDNFNVGLYKLVANGADVQSPEFNKQMTKLQRQAMIDVIAKKGPAVEKGWLGPKNTEVGRAIVKVREVMPEEKKGVKNIGINKGLYDKMKKK